MHEFVHKTHYPASMSENAVAIEIDWGSKRVFDASGEMLVVPIQVTELEKFDWGQCKHCQRMVEVQGAADHIQSCSEAPMSVKRKYDDFGYLCPFVCLKVGIP